VVAAEVAPAALDEAVAEVDAGGSEIVATVLDVRDLGQVQALAAEVLARFGRVDLVVNNAGVIGSRAYLWEQDQSDWRWVRGVSFFGVLHGVRAFVHLVAARRGHVVNTASVTGIGLLGGASAPTPRVSTPSSV
jgi:NAD(P)-dependent dehydrogenase (short-subunit alcohol dehydrogenase family)